MGFFPNKSLFFRCLNDHSHKLFLCLSKSIASIISFFLSAEGSVQLLSCVQLFATPWTSARQAFLSFTVSWNLLKFMFIELVMPSSHLILCLPISSRLQSFQASVSCSWFNILAVQGTLQSLLQHHSLKASVLWCSTLSSNSYMRT